MIKNTKAQIVSLLLFIAIIFIALGGNDVSKESVAPSEIDSVVSGQEETIGSLVLNEEENANSVIKETTTTIPIVEKEEILSFRTQELNSKEDIFEGAFLANIVGDVSVEREFGEILAMELLQILEGDIIFTGEDSSVDLLIGAHKTITLGANSILLFRNSATCGENEKTILVLKEGTCVSDVDEKLDDGDSFEVMTPTQIISIRGTIASVSYDSETQESEILFFEGFGLIADIETRNVSAIVAGQSLQVIDGSFQYAIIEKEKLNEENLKYVEKNEDVFNRCREKINNAKDDLTKKPQVEDIVYEFEINFEDVPVEFFEMTTEVETRFKKEQEDKKVKKEEKLKEEKLKEKEPKE